jgi:hypothetical protein
MWDDGLPSIFFWKMQDEALDVYVDVDYKNEDGSSMNDGKDESSMTPNGSYQCASRHWRTSRRCGSNETLCQPPS